jgi:hypothetical protein
MTPDLQIRGDATCKSTAKRANGKAAAKPQMPFPDFPLFPHATDRWAKKVRVKSCCLGKVADDPKGVARKPRRQDARGAV